MHRPILETHTEHWPDESACEAAAGRLAKHTALQDAFVELAGPLGAGKTTFVRHLLRALGIAGRIKSPSFAVVETYEFADAAQRRHAVSHFDFYRFADPREWLDAGFRDSFAAPGLKLVEWAAHAGPELPAPDLRLELTPLDGDPRSVTYSAITPRGQELLP